MEANDVLKPLTQYTADKFVETTFRQVSPKIFFLLK